MHQYFFKYKTDGFLNSGLTSHSLSHSLAHTYTHTQTTQKETCTHTDTHTHLYMYVRIRISKLILPSYSLYTKGTSGLPDIHLKLEGHTLS